jgi:hypothetical protein
VAEGAGERRPGGQELVAAAGGLGELVGRLEAGQQRVGLGRVQALVLQLHAHLDQKAVARQAQSSSPARPARQAAPNRAAGDSRAEPIGPLASAS